MDNLEQYGIAGLLAVVTVREIVGVFSRGVVTRLADRLEKIDKRTETTAGEVHVLLEQHAPVDDDGVPVWYVRRSMERAVERLALAVESITRLPAAIETMTELLRQLAAELRETRAQVALHDRRHET